MKLFGGGDAHPLTFAKLILPLTSCFHSWLLGKMHLMMVSKLYPPAIIQPVTSIAIEQVS